MLDVDGEIEALDRCLVQPQILQQDLAAPDLGMNAGVCGGEGIY
jgi:hypothetical protein